MLVRTRGVEEQFSLVRADGMRNTGLGLSQGGETEEEEEEELLGYDSILYLAPEHHKAPGLLQRVSSVRLKIGFSHVFIVNAK